METEPRREGKGSDVHCSERRDLTIQASEPQPSSDTIGAFMPWVIGEERSLRNRLLFFRQRARTRTRHSHDETAYGQWMLARDLADMWSTEPCSKAHLQDVLQVITRVAMTADAIERWSAPA
jgi:hypothetical protein